MNILLGPADADHFRVKVGRYGDRWYTDPLPECPIAPATGDVWPSFSTTKKASGKDWTMVGLKRVAHALERDPSCLTGLDFGRRYDALASINKRALEQAGTRGTNVHHRAEARLRGRTALVPERAPGREYDAAVDAFFQQYQPELVAAEFVVVHRDLNGVGYGCTVDARIRIDGELLAVDWKSRGEDSDHGAYPEEGAQLAAGTRGQYMIVEGSDGSERRRMDDVDGAIIVSIRPDGCRVYPVDIDKAWSHYESMHAWWVARRDERQAIGKPWAPRKVAAVVPAPKPAPAPEPPPFDEPPEPLTPAAQKGQLRTSPAEGDIADANAFAALERHYVELSASARSWITELAKSAQQHGVSFHAKEARTVRRFEVIRGLVALALSNSHDDETLRAVLASVVGDVANFANVTPGHLVGSLSAGEAAIFARRVDELISSNVPASVTDDGTVVLHFTGLAATTAA